jgi:hypothetical protein
MSAGSIGYVVLVAFCTHVISMLFMGSIVAMMSETMFRRVTVNSNGTTKKRLTIWGALVNAIISTLLFWGVIAMELGSQEFRDNFG